jgi:hypothetical protein
MKERKKERKKFSLFSNAIIEYLRMGNLKRREVNLAQILEFGVFQQHAAGIFSASGEVLMLLQIEVARGRVRGQVRSRQNTE